MNDYRFEELKKDLSTGREVEFQYKGNKYSISHNKEGWYLTRFGDDTEQSFANSNDLLKYGTIEAKTLNEIWDEVIVESIF